MPSLKKLAAISFAIAALAGATTVQAQTDSAASAAAPAAPAAPTKKDIRKQNHQLESKVRHALTKTPHLDSSSITILARSGKITLEGMAPDDDQIKLAGKTAASVPGVSKVTNNVTVHEAGN